MPSTRLKAIISTIGMTAIFQASTSPRLTICPAGTWSTSVRMKATTSPPIDPISPSCEIDPNHTKAKDAAAMMAMRSIGTSAVIWISGAMLATAAVATTMMPSAWATQ